MASQTNTDCGNFTLDFKHLAFCASPIFLQTMGPWFPNEMQNVLYSEKRTLDHWESDQLFYFFSPGKTLLTSFFVQERLDKRNTTFKTHFTDLSVCGGSWCTHPSLSPVLVKLSNTFERPFAHNPLQAVVIPAACAPFLPHFALPVNFLSLSWITEINELLHDILIF